MGYYIFSYAVNKTLVEKTFGSKDEQLLNNVLDTKYLSYDKKRNVDRYNELKAALEEMIFGEPYDKERKTDYWYAFIALCEYLNKSITPYMEIKAGHVTDTVDEVLASEYGIKISIENLFLNRKVDFGLPIHNDFPASGLWDKADLHEIHSLIKDIRISDDRLETLEGEDYDKYEASRIIKKIGEDVVHCLENELVLISFCH
ncbi:MAG TPA: hypothetical protein VIM79_22905 [Niastella sp.]